jgi:hypothetical protein
MSSLILAGDTSGAITLTVPATAGTNTITLPASTGTAITTASTSGIPNTVNWTTVQTSSVSPAVAGTGYPMNTTAGALTVTLPAAPAAGNIISIVDYAGTAATNNITINPNGLKIQGGTANAVLSTNREAINLVYVDSTQGWLAYADVYSTTSPLPQPYTASYLLVAGGGGAAGAGTQYNSGGAGAGGLVTGTTSFIPGTVYTATIGGGGAGATGAPYAGSSGGTSSFPGLTSAVGGGFPNAGNSPANSGTSGGSGGGGGGGGTTPGGAGTPGQGNAGGSGLAGVAGGGGGGGGAGATGGNCVPGTSGAGGAGTASSITGTPATYAGGGSGGADSRGASAGAAGSGGGGQGSTGPGGSSPTANSGGGGGGCGYPGGNGGSGSSGVIILSVPTANYSGTTTGSPTITTSGANTVIKYTGSGTYTA